MAEPLTNKRIAALLAETADLLEIAGQDGFRVRAYRNAAQVIETYPEDLAEAARDPGRDISNIKSIGKGIKEHIEEIVERGTFARREELLAKYPPTALELLKIGGLGPKTIAAIYANFKISTVDGLETLCREGKLRDLPRMGEKLEQKILEGIESYKRSAGRYLIDHAADVSGKLIPYLLESDGVEQVSAAGSLRRGKETIGDLDLIVSGPGAQTALDRLVEHPSVVKVLAHGKAKASVEVGREEMQVDVRAMAPESYGAAMLYFTGSKEHNIALRDRAARRGLRLNEYGLYRNEDGERQAGEDEAGIYEALGLRWIPPELREGTGEIEASEEDALPELVDLDGIRGDLHMHTTESDGRFSLGEMAEAARECGLEYIAITDHSKAMAMANGLDEKRLLKQAREVRKLSERTEKLTILAGCEVDILRDGRLDIADDALAQLDIVIASVHSSMNLEPAEMTERLLACLENPHVMILGHGTGRLLLRREPYRYDFERVAGAAAKRGVAFEINASPHRLDLGPERIRLAKKSGAKFVISTDAHHVSHFANMRYGVLTARRGWLESADVLNTHKLKPFQNALRRN